MEIGNAYSKIRHFVQRGEDGEAIGVLIELARHFEGRQHAKHYSCEMCEMKSMLSGMNKKRPPMGYEPGAAYSDGQSANVYWAELDPAIGRNFSYTFSRSTGGLSSGRSTINRTDIQEMQSPF